MGLDNPAIKFCCAAKSMGVSFEKTVMIGRQYLSPDFQSLQQVFSTHGITRDPKDFLAKNTYAEEFFRLLGAEQIESLDYSDYEGATIIQDLNAPLNDELREKFSVVFDGGSLEHVFNIPQALENSMNMVEVGGHFVQVTVANNYMGHGLWQLSPELIFRVLSPENGFETELMMLHENRKNGIWVVVTDPIHARQRVALCNYERTYLLTIAKRVSREKVFATTPIQSDYQDRWDSAGQKSESKFDQVGNTAELRTQVLKLAGKLGRFVSEDLKRKLRPVLRKDPFDRAYYRPIEEDDLLKGQLE